MKELLNELKGYLQIWKNLKEKKGNFKLESTEYLYKINNYEILYLWGKMHRYMAPEEIPSIEEWAKEELVATIEDLIESLDPNAWREELEKLKKYADLSDESYDYELSHQLAEELFFELDKAQLAVWSANKLAHQLLSDEELHRLKKLVEKKYPRGEQEKKARKRVEELLNIKFRENEELLKPLLDELFENQVMLEMESSLFAFLAPYLDGEMKSFREDLVDPELWKLTGKYEYIAGEHQLLLELVPEESELTETSPVWERGTSEEKRPFLSFIFSTLSKLIKEHILTGEAFPKPALAAAKKRGFARPLPYKTFQFTAEDGSVAGTVKFIKEGDSEKIDMKFIFDDYPSDRQAYLIVGQKTYPIESEELKIPSIEKMESSDLENIYLKIGEQKRQIIIGVTQ